VRPSVRTLGQQSHATLRELNLELCPARRSILRPCARPAPAQTRPYRLAFKVELGGGQQVQREMRQINIEYGDRL
jgi:hypothetical protein